MIIEKISKPFSKKWLISYGLILLGAFILALSFVSFISPYYFVPGGVYGISIVMHHLWGTPTGFTALCMDIPLTLIGIRILGPKFGFKTVIGFLSTAIFVDLLQSVLGEKPLIVGDALLSAIFGGAIMGVGIGLIFRARATSGGSDIIAMILEKYTRMPLGKLLIYIDSSIVLLGVVAFHDWKIPFYSWIVIFVSGKVIDIILQGANYEKTLFIITQQPELIREKIINDLNRGGTLIPGKGLYQYADRTMLFTVLSRREAEILKDFIRTVDPTAFVAVVEANEIFGEGFKPLVEHNK